MAERLRGAGYDIVSSHNNQSVVITNKLDQQTRSLLGSGHRVIVLANDKDALPDGPIKITPRNCATGYDGNWVTNFNRANVNRAPFSAVAFDKLFGFEIICSPAKRGYTSRAPTLRPARHPGAYSINYCGLQSHARLLSRRE